MLSHYWWDYSMQFSCYNKSNENAGNISVCRCIMSPMNLFFTLKSEIGKVRRQQQLIHIYGLANDITVEAFSLSWKSTFLCCLMNENANQNKNWEMIISQAKAINMAAAARAERCEEILPPQSKLFPSFSLTLCSLYWVKITALEFMLLQTRIFSHAFAFLLPFS